jgi:multidrug resistance efflux pump
VSFPRTRSALEDEGRTPRALLWGTALLGALWLGWLLLGTLELIEEADNVRLEVGRAVHPVDAPGAGRVTAVYVRLGQEVAAGQPLLALENDRASASLREAEARISHLQERLASALRERAAEQQLARSDGAAARSALEEGRARERVSAAESALADAELSYANRLKGNGLVSELELVRRAAEAERKRAALAGARTALATLDADRQARAQRDTARLEHLNEEVAAGREERAALDARIAVLRQELADRIVRAPVAGRVGGIGGLQAGAVVAPGARIAEIVPVGTVHAVALFPLQSAGRLRAGQPARLRLAAYPWTQYGAVRARVRSVGSEPDGGRVRVELELAQVPPGIVAAHGLVGSLAVEVGRVAPLALALRLAGGAESSRP